jgi:hypothetical protein
MAQSELLSAKKSATQGTREASAALRSSRVTGHWEEVIVVRVSASGYAVVSQLHLVLVNTHCKRARLLSRWSLSGSWKIIH